MTSKTVKKTKADQIWDQIKNLNLDLYGFGGQTLEKHSERLPVSDSVVHLRLRATAVLPALETSLRAVGVPEGQKFEVLQHSNFITVGMVQDLDYVPEQK